VSLKLEMMVILWLRRPLGGGAFKRRSFEKLAVGEFFGDARPRSGLASAAQQVEGAKHPKTGGRRGAKPLNYSSRITDAIVCNGTADVTVTFGVRSNSDTGTAIAGLSAFITESGMGVAMLSRHTPSAGCAGAGGWVTAEDSP